MGDVALDISALAHPVHRAPVSRCFAPVGSPPGRLLLSGHPLMRVASSEIANGRGGEACVALEEAPRLAWLRVDTAHASAAHLALHLREQQLAQVRALAVDHAAASADPALATAARGLVRHHTGRLRAANHGDAKHLAQGREDRRPRRGTKKDDSEVAAREAAAGSWKYDNAKGVTRNSPCGGPPKG